MKEKEGEYEKKKGNREREFILNKEVEKMSRERERTKDNIK